MSFGVGVGDLVAISQLAFKLYSNFENFEGSIARASDTFTSVFLALTLLECEELVFSNVQGTFHNDRLLERAVSNCGTTLEELMGILERHNLSTVERFHRPKYQSNIFLSDVERAWKDPVSYTSELRAWILMCGSPFISNEYEANPPALMRESQLPDPGESLWTTHHGRGQRSRTACVSAPNRSQCCTLGAETLSDRTITILPAIDCALTPFVYARKSIVSSDDALRQLHLEDGHLRQLQLKSSQRRVSNRTLASHQADHPPRGPASFVSTIHRLCIRKTLSFHSPTLLTLLYPLLFVSSASAMDHGSPMIQAHLQLETQDHISWLQALHSSQKELLSLWTQPKNRTIENHEPDPSIILLACFLCITFVALTAQVRRADAYQPHIVGICAALSAVGGASATVDVTEFAFVYLFWGCVGGLMSSMVFHWAMALAS